MRTTKQTGFTLIELLVVIAIVAILAVVVVLTLNPAQLLRQARDSNRISDLNTLKSALSLYLSDVASPSLGSSTFCYAHVSSSISACSPTSSARFAAGTVATTTSSSIAVDGTGWIPVTLTSISAGSPISALPLDPVNNSTSFYAYRPDATNLTFELNANMESTKYASAGSADVENTDGGDTPTIYEVGTDPGLNL